MSTGRFVTVPYYLAENPEISASAKTVYIAIKSHLPNIYCSISRVEKLTGITRKTIVKAIKELEHWQLISVKRTHRQTNIYTIRQDAVPIRTDDYIDMIQKRASGIITHKK